MCVVEENFYTPLVEEDKIENEITLERIKK